MKLTLFFTGFMLCSSVCAQQEHAGRSISSDSAVAHTRSLVQREFKKHDYPGLALAVWHDGKLIWSEGFGYANIQDGIKVDPSRSLFRIGSVSKSLTATGLAKLAERGVLDLDATVQTFVPAFPEKKWPITIRQVAQHTAGIRHYRGFEYYSNTHYSTVTDAIGVFSNDTLLFKPDENYSYSSYGWNLISAVMEGASKIPFTDFMMNEIFLPSGMMHTFPDDVMKRDLPRVAFYDSLSGANVLCPSVDNSIKWAGGGFLSTAEDLVHFGEAILNYTLISEETQQVFWTRATLANGKQTNYGLGWTLNADKKGREWVGHSGGSVGGSSMFLVYPEERLIVVTLINRSQADAIDLAFLIANQFLN